MATTVTLRLKFGTMAGVRTWNFKNIDTAAQATDVANLMQTMINNGDIYETPPLTAESAEVIVTETRSIPVDTVTPATMS